MGCQLRHAALSAVVLACLAAPAARAAETVTLGTVGQASANLWPELIALDQGFFAAEGLQVDLVYVQSSAALVQQVAAGSLGIAAQTGLADPLRAVGMGAPIAVVRIDVQAPPYDLVAKPGITNMKRAQGQGDIAWRAEGHHPHLCRAHAGAERRNPGRLRHGVRRRHDRARLGAARRRGRCRNSAAAVQLSGGGEGLQQPRPDGGLREGPAVLRHLSQCGVGQRQQGDAGETAAGENQEHRLVRGRAKSRWRAAHPKVRHRA